MIDRDPGSCRGARRCARKKGKIVKIVGAKMKPLKRSTSSPTSIRSDDQDRSEAGSFDEQGRRSDIKETISILETRGKKLCSDLRSLQMGRAELTREVELLSESLEKKRGVSPRGSPRKSVACHRLYRREVSECSPYEDCEQCCEHPSAEGKFKYEQCFSHEGSVKQTVSFSSKIRLAGGPQLARSAYSQGCLDWLGK